MCSLGWRHSACLGSLGREVRSLVWELHVWFPIRLLSENRPSTRTIKIVHHFVFQEKQNNFECVSNNWMGENRASTCAYNFFSFRSREKFLVSKSNDSRKVEIEYVGLSHSPSTTRFNPLVPVVAKLHIACSSVSPWCVSDEEIMHSAFYLE